MTDAEKKANQQGYSKGYQAGLKRKRRERYAAVVKNDRATHLAAAIIANMIDKNWGEIVDGKHRKYNLNELEDAAARAANRMTQQMTVY